MTDAAIPTSVPSAPKKGGELGQWALIYRRFRRHKLAYWSGFVVIAIYMVALFADFIAPFTADSYNPRYIYTPPQTLKFFGTDAQGRTVPIYVNGYKMEMDPVALKRRFVEDPSRITPVGFFVKGQPYNLLGIIPMDRHLFGPHDPSAPMYLWGTDRMGRDLLAAPFSEQGSPMYDRSGRGRDQSLARHHAWWAFRLLWRLGRRSGSTNDRLP